MFDPKMTVVSVLIASVCVAAPVSRADDDPPVEPAAEPAEGSEETPAPDESAPESAGAPLEEKASADQARQLDLAIHYILIGKPDLVNSSIQALFDSQISDGQLALLIDERGLKERLERALARGRGMEGAGDMVAQLESRVHAGNRANNRDGRLIDQAVKNLGGTMRQQMLARAQLMAGGEFAVPALLHAIISGENQKVSMAARTALVDIKRLAVTPLCAALPHLDPRAARQVCEILSEIGYPSAQPYLLALAQNPSTPTDVASAATAAYQRLGGNSTSAASQFGALAKRYFDRTPALIPVARDADTPVWYFVPNIGLSGTEIPTSVYCETMAMSAAREALLLDPTLDSALAIYVAADLRRSATLQELGVESAASSEEEAESTAPSILGSRFSADFFATAAGARIGQMALGMAIDANDPALARALIAALAANGSATALVAPESGRSPLLECLAFADRRVRFDAALALARALPQSKFDQDALVVPILASMVQAQGLTGAAIAASVEDRTALESRLNGVGINGVSAGGTFSEAEGKGEPGQTLDLVVVQGSRELINESVRAIRVSRSAWTAPVVAVAHAGDAAVLAIDFEGDPRVSIFSSNAPDTAFAKAVEMAFGGAGGLALTPEQAEAYSDDALDALELLANSGSTVFQVGECEGTLVNALSTATGASRLHVAQVMALLPTQRAQRTLMDAALEAEGDEQARLLLSVATSARRGGNLCAPSQVQKLRELIQSSTGDVANAAGNAYGALGLPTDEVVKLITAP